MRTKRLKIWQNQKTCANIFRLSIFFVTDLPLYLLQGGRKTAFVENIYTISRLRERQTASNIEKQKNTRTDFLDFLSFLWKSHLAISNRVAVKHDPKKTKKKVKKKTKKLNFREKNT